MNTHTHTRIYESSELEGFIAMEIANGTTFSRQLKSTHKREQTTSFHWFFSTPHVLGLLSRERVPYLYLLQLSRDVCKRYLSVAFRERQRERERCLHAPRAKLASDTSRDSLEYLIREACVNVANIYLA